MVMIWLDSLEVAGPATSLVPDSAIALYNNALYIEFYNDDGCG